MGLRMFELETNPQRTSDYFVWSLPSGNALGRPDIIEWIKEHDMMVKIRIKCSWVMNDSFIVKYEKFKVSWSPSFMSLESFIFYSQEDYNLFKLTWI